MKLFLSVKIELYDILFLWFQIHHIQNYPLTGLNHRLTNADETMLSLLLFCTSKSMFNSFCYHSSSWSLAFCQLSVSLYSLVPHNPNNCLIIFGIQRTWPGAPLLHFLAPSLTSPQLLPLTLEFSTETTEEKWVLCKHSGPGLSTPSFLPVEVQGTQERLIKYWWSDNL